MSKKYKIAIFASGSGTNAEEIFKHFKSHPDIEFALLMTNNPEAFALQRAANYNIAAEVFSRAEFKEGERTKSELQKHGITHIVLDAFLWFIPDYLLQLFPYR